MADGLIEGSLWYHEQNCEG